MELSVSEVATLLGVSPRTVRARRARGELAGTKRGERWMVAREALPLSDAQRRSLQARADAVRATVDAALPGRLARTLGSEVRTLWDLDAFRLGVELTADLRASEAPGAADAALELELGLMALAEGVHVFDRGRKLAALDEARARVGRASARLLISGGSHDPSTAFVSRLEGQVGPAIAGYARWVSRLGKDRR